MIIVQDTALGPAQKKLYGFSQFIDFCSKSPETAREIDGTVSSICYEDAIHINKKVANDAWLLGHYTGREIARRWDIESAMLKELSFVWHNPGTLKGAYEKTDSLRTHKAILYLSRC